MQDRIIDCGHCWHLHYIRLRLSCLRYELCNDGTSRLQDCELGQLQHRKSDPLVLARRNIAFGHHISIIYHNAVLACTCKVVSITLWQDNSFNRIEQPVAKAWAM